MVWLERLRMAGIAATYVLIVVYGTFEFGDLLPLLQNHLVDTAIGTPAMLLGMLLLVVVAERTQRRTVLASLGVPAGRIASLVGASLVIGFTVNLIMQLDPYGHGMLASVALWLLQFVTAVVLVVVLAPAALLIGYLAVRHWCVAADGHPMLPAVITVFYAAIQLGLFVVEGGLTILPDGLRVTVGVGGPVCLAAIAAAELRLHVAAGTSIRSLR
jgi:hypothetical protein